MSINVNTINYDTAREYLAAAASPLDDISIDIGEAIKNLDSRIIPYVIGDYNYVNNQIKNVYASNEILSTEIENFKQKCKTIEDKATGAISRKKRTTPYPRREIEDFIKEHGDTFIMTSDCHDKDYLLCHFEESDKIYEGIEVLDFEDLLKK